MSNILPDPAGHYAALGPLPDPPTEPFWARLIPNWSRTMAIAFAEAACARMPPDAARECLREALHQVQEEIKNEQLSNVQLAGAVAASGTD